MDKIADLPLGQEVVDLVVAARELIYGGNADLPNLETADGLSITKPLDQALEKFASIVPWENEPDSEGYLPHGEISIDGLRKALAAFIEPDSDTVYAGCSRDNKKRIIHQTLTGWADNIRAGELDGCIAEIFRPHVSDKPDEISFDCVTSKEQAERMARHAENPVITFRQILGRSGVALTDSDRLRLETLENYCDQPADLDRDPRDEHITELRDMVERGHARERDLVQLGETLRAELASSWKRLAEAEAIIDDAGKVLGSLQQKAEADASSDFTESDALDLADRAEAFPEGEE